MIEPSAELVWAGKVFAPSQFLKPTYNLLKSVSLARDEAIKLDLNRVGSEHLLLGAINVDSDNQNSYGGIIKGIGVNPLHVEAAVRFIMGRGIQPVNSGNLELSPLSKKVRDATFEEALKLGGGKVVGVEHLLLGLTRAEGGFAVGVLEALGINYIRARDYIKQHRIARIGEQPVVDLDKLISMDITSHTVESLHRLILLMEDPSFPPSRKEQISKITESLVQIFTSQ